MQKQRRFLGCYKDSHGRTRPITKSESELNRKKFIKPNGSRWTLTYKRTRQLKQLSLHFLEKDKPKCYFCHKPLTEKDLPDNITEHHINGNHYDGRTRNKVLCHETCHRQYHYAETCPRNPGKGGGKSKHKTAICYDFQELSPSEFKKAMQIVKREGMVLFEDEGDQNVFFHDTSAKGRQVAQILDKELVHKPFIFEIGETLPGEQFQTFYGKWPPKPFISEKT